MSDRRNAVTVGDSKARYRMILFVADDECNSRAARANLTRLCEEELAGRCEVRIVDVMEEVEMAVKHDILVTPALLLMEPAPAVMVVGTLKDRDNVRRALRLDGGKP